MTIEYSVYIKIKTIYKNYVYLKKNKKFKLIVHGRRIIWVNLLHLINQIVSEFFQFLSCPVLSSIHSFTISIVNWLRGRRPVLKQDIKLTELNK